MPVNYLDTHAPMLPVSQPKNTNTTRVVPVYYIEFEDPSLTKKVQKFIATKLDEMNSVVKLVGIGTQENIKTISKDYSKILSSADKDSYIEIMVPWHRVCKIQNLIFKHK